MAFVVHEPLASSSPDVPDLAPPLILPPLEFPKTLATLAPSSTSTTQRPSTADPRGGYARKSSFQSVRPALFWKKAIVEDARRDSGLTSTSTTDQSSTEMARPATSAGPGSSWTSRPASRSGVPSIVLNDGRRTSLSFLRRPMSRRGRDTLSEMQEQPLVEEPFVAIATPIPSGEFADPFSSTTTEFSKRGSMFLNGAKLNGIAEMPNHSRANSSISSLPKRDLAPTTPQTSQLRPSTAQETTRTARHQPTLSSENHRLSRRVRSWYGTEGNPPKAVTHVESAGARKVSSEEADTISELPSNLAPRQGTSDGRTYNSLGRGQRSEAAGGIEDWTDLEGVDVDRYGFYSVRALQSKQSSAAPTPAPGTPDQSVRQAPLSSTPQTRPVSQQTALEPPPSRSNRASLAGGRTRLASPSIRTTRSRNSTSSVLRPLSRSSRRREEAANMLSSFHGLEVGEPMPEQHLTFTLNRDRALESRRARKWARMATVVPTEDSKKGGGTDFRFNTNDAKLISRTWKGIPDCWRGAAWYAFVSQSASKRSPTGKPEPPDEVLESFLHSCQDDDCPDDIQIDADVPRTVGGHVIFRQRFKGGQRFLFRVLRALSIYFPATGYVQGMATVVATLLNYYTEERAFVMAVRLWTLRGIGWLYSEDFVRLKAALDDLEKSWLRNSPVVRHLDSINVDITAWGPKWYLTLFNYVLPFPAQLRIWDVFFLLGDPSGPPPAPKLLTAKGATTPATANGDSVISSTANTTLSSDTISATSVPSLPTTNPTSVSPTQSTVQPPAHLTALLEQRPNLDVIHATASAMITALSDTLVDAEFENAMKVLTSPVPVAREDVLMGVARREWSAKSRR